MLIFKALSCIQIQDAIINTQNPWAALLFSLPLLLSLVLSLLAAAFCSVCKRGKCDFKGILVEEKVKTFGQSL